MNDKPELKTLLAESEKRKRAGQLEEALCIARTAVDSFPNHLSARLQMARSLVQLERHGEAEDTLQVAEESHPGSGSVQLEKARAALATDRGEDALDFCKQAIALSPDNLSAHHELARIYRSLDQTDHAIAAARDALRLAPQHVGLITMLVRLLQSKDQHAEAIAVVRDAMDAGVDDQRLMIDLRHSYTMLARSYYNARQFEDTVRTCDEAVSVVGPGDRILAFLCRSLINLCRFDEAESPARELLELSPGDARGWHALARVYHERKHFESAVEAWSRCVEFDSGNADAWRSLVKTHFTLRNREQLTETFSRAEAALGGTAENYLLLAQLAYDVELPEGEEENYRRAADAGADTADTAETIFLKGCVRYQKGEISEASKSFKMALELAPACQTYLQRYQECELLADKLALAGITTFPQSLTDQIRLATDMVESQRYEAAETVLEVVEQSSPDSAAVHLAKARVAAAADRHIDALQHCKRAIELKPTYFSAHNELARLHRTLGQTDLAIDAARAALALQPDHVVTLVMLARLLQKRNQHLESIRAIQDALRILPDDEKLRGELNVAYATVARDLYSELKFDEVIEVCHNALTHVADNERILGYLCQALIQLNRYQEALEPAGRLQRMCPNSEKSWRLLARIHHGTKDWDQSEQAWRRSIELEPGCIESWSGLLKLQLSRSRNQNVRETLQKARDVFGSSAEGQLRIAEIACRAELYAECDEHLQYAIEIAGDNAAVLFDAGRIKYRDGRISQAERYFARASQLDAMDSNYRQYLDRCQRLAEKLSSPNDNEEIVIPESVVRHFAERPKQCYEPVPGKVMLLSHHFGSGGAERQVINTVKGLLQHANLIQEVVLVCKSNKQSEREKFFCLDELEGLPVRVLSIAGGNDSNHQRAINQLGDQWDLIKPFPSGLRGDVLRLFDIIQNERPAIVHAWQDKLNISAGLAAVLCGTPRVILSARNTPPNSEFRQKTGQRYLRESYRALLRSEHVALTHNSRNGAIEYGSWLDEDGENFPVVYNGVDFDGIERGIQDHGQLSQHVKRLPDVSGPVIGSVFRLTEQKRPELWLRTAQLISRQRPDVTFAIVGEGPLRADVLRMAEDFEIAEKLVLPGRSSRVGAWYDFMDLFLLSSAIEGLPNVVIEALGFGVPCISTRTGGVEEIIANEKTGWVVDEATPEALAERLLWCLDHPEWMQTAGRTGRQDVRQRFSTDAMISTTLSLYEMVAQT